MVKKTKQTHLRSLMPLNGPLHSLEKPVKRVTHTSQDTQRDLQQEKERPRESKVLVMVLRPCISGASRNELQRGPGSVGTDPHLHEAAGLHPGRSPRTFPASRREALVLSRWPGLGRGQSFGPILEQQSGGGSGGISSSKRGTCPARWQGPRCHALPPAHPRDGGLWLF